MLDLRRPATHEMPQEWWDRNPLVAVVQIACPGYLADRFARLGITAREHSAIVRLAQPPGVGIPAAAVDAAGEVDLTTERPAGHDITESHPPLVMPVAPPARDSVAGATVDAADVAWHVCTSDVDDAEAVRRSGARKTALVDERVRRFDELAHELLMTPGGVRLVGIDGGGGGGEKTVAARLAASAGGGPPPPTHDLPGRGEPAPWGARPLAH